MQVPWAQARGVSHGSSSGLSLYTRRGSLKKPATYALRRHRVHRNREGEAELAVRCSKAHPTSSRTADLDRFVGIEPEFNRPYQCVTNAALQRSTFAKMISALWGQTKGLGARLYSSRDSWIAARSALRLAKLPRRLRCWVISRSQRSTRLSQEPPVGVMEAGLAFQPARDRRTLVGAGVVHDERQVEVRWPLLVEGPQEPEELPAAVPGQAPPDDLAVEQAEGGAEGAGD